MLLLLINLRPPVSAAVSLGKCSYARQQDCSTTSIYETIIPAGRLWSVNVVASVWLRYTRVDQQGAAVRMSYVASLPTCLVVTDCRGDDRPRHACIVSLQLIWIDCRKKQEIMISRILFMQCVQN